MFCHFSLELSQDVASKGLGLVYEMGGEADQQELVSTLVETLMTGKRLVKHQDCVTKIQNTCVFFVFVHNACTGNKLFFETFLHYIILEMDLIYLFI